MAMAVRWDVDHCDLCKRAQAGGLRTHPELRDGAVQLEVCDSCYAKEFKAPLKEHLAQHAFKAVTSETAAKARKRAKSGWAKARNGAMIREGDLVLVQGKPGVFVRFWFPQGDNPCMIFGFRRTNGTPEETLLDWLTVREDVHKLDDPTADEAHVAGYITPPPDALTAWGFVPQKLMPPDDDSDITIANDGGDDETAVMIGQQWPQIQGVGPIKIGASENSGVVNPERPRRKKKSPPKSGNVGDYLEL